MRRNRKSTVITLGTIVGLALTVVTTIRGTIKAQEELKKKEPQTTIDKVKTVAPCYIGSAIAVTGTILCIVAKDKVHKKELASVTGLSVAAANRYYKYRKRIKEEIGEEREQEIYDEVVEDDFCISPLLPYSPEKKRKFRFKDVESGLFFYSDFEKVIHAMYHFNRDFQARQVLPWRKWYYFLGVKPPKRIAHQLDTKGWNTYDFWESGYEFPWIDFYTNFIAKPKDGSEPYYEIYLSESPYEDYDKEE